MHFSDFSFHQLINKNIAAQGFTEPTPIQEQAMPAVLDGRDVMGLAQTGTGKTAAFMLPILQKLMAMPPKQRRGPRALILAPTRELAEQIHQTAIELGRQTGIRSVTVYGGVGIAPQMNALRRGPSIVVACPGRLLDVMGRGAVDLSGLDTLVLDEADHMFDMGFLPDIRRIIAALPKKRQNLLFSATMPSSIRSLAEDILTNPEVVRIGHLAPAETVTHECYPITKSRKTDLLLSLLDGMSDGSVLVFTKTKHMARRVAERLAKTGHKATALQGNMSQNKRKAAMDGFRRGSYQVLVATDIAARGIDVSRVAHVVNFDTPDTPEAYTHRIGRTGRASRSGTAHTFVTGEDGYIVRAIERLLGAKLNRNSVEGFEHGPMEWNNSKPARPAKPARKGGYQGKANDRTGYKGKATPKGGKPGGKPGRKPGFKSEDGQDAKSGQGRKRTEQRSGQHADNRSERPIGRRNDRKTNYRKTTGHDARA